MTDFWDTLAAAFSAVGRWWLGLPVGGAWPYVLVFVIFLALVLLLMR